MILVKTIISYLANKLREFLWSADQHSGTVKYELGYLANLQQFMYPHMIHVIRVAKSYMSAGRVGCYWISNLAWPSTNMGTIISTSIWRLSQTCNLLWPLPSPTRVMTTDVFHPRALSPYCLLAPFSLRHSRTILCPDMFFSGEGDHTRSAILSPSIFAQAGESVPRNWWLRHLSRKSLLWSPPGSVNNSLKGLGPSSLLAVPRMHLIIDRLISKCCCRMIQFTIAYLVCCCF